MLKRIVMITVIIGTYCTLGSQLPHGKEILKKIDANLKKLVYFFHFIFIL